MSLKDDFLEALRSVKRDFIGDYESPAPAAQEAQRAAPVSPQPTEHIPPVNDMTGQEEAGENDFPPSFSERPHIRDTFQPELHTPAEVETPEHNAAYDIKKESLPADETPFEPSFSDSVPDLFEDEARYGGGDDGGEPPDDGDGRFIMDGFELESGGDERTVISKNTVIRGALQTDDSVRMFGQILGDIECRSNILVAGKVRGNTSAANAYVIGAQVDGNLLCDDAVNVTDDAWILGNIRAQQADVDGKIKGNIEIRHSILIGKNSSVIGNISTDELEIKRGAFVNGQIMMYSPSRDVIDRFDSFDQ